MLIPNFFLFLTKYFHNFMPCIALLFIKSFYSLGGADRWNFESLE